MIVPVTGTTLFSDPREVIVSRKSKTPAEGRGTPPPLVSNADLARVREVDGRLHEILGAHVRSHDGAEGTAFGVWAPGARSVSVVGSFNGWDREAHPMESASDTGVWTCFVPGVGAGALYKYHVLSRVDGQVRLKSDPCGRAMELRPDTASVVVGRSRHQWRDQAWMEARSRAQAPDRPLSIYEVHLGSWRRHPGADPRSGHPGWMSFRELADVLVPYVADLGFTHIEVLPITEHPYDASWGYQTVGYFAPTSRHGSPDDLRYLVDTAHQAGMGIILDWVPAHFPQDPHGLGRFDGTHLYEHADPRKGVHPDWDTYIFNYGREEVVAFLVSSALHWIESYHVDGLRLDAVASMLYLDYSRDEGAWVPNPYGGRENLEAVEFLRVLNDTVHAEHPGVLVMAEESTAWPGVTHSPEQGGLGFDIKWNMGWMHDTLEVMGADPLFRKGVYDRLTFGITYAFAERFLLPLSHDEVVHMKRSLLTKMAGSTLDKFAALRLLYGYMWTHPGKKLLFMGGEFGAWNEWDAEGELDWALISEPMHSGMMRWVRDLNGLYSDAASLHETDADGRGFEWIDCHDRNRSTLSYVRWSSEWKQHLVVVANFTPMPWTQYRLAVPAAGAYHVRLCSDDVEYGGGGMLDQRFFAPTAGELFGREQWIEFTLPPHAVVVFEPDAAG